MLTGVITYKTANIVSSYVMVGVPAVALFAVSDVVWNGAIGAIVTIVLGFLQVWSQARSAERAEAIKKSNEVTAMKVVASNEVVAIKVDKNDEKTNKLITDVGVMHIAVNSGQTRAEESMKNKDTVIVELNKRLAVLEAYLIGKGSSPAPVTPVAATSTTASDGTKPDDRLLNPVIKVEDGDAEEGTYQKV